jgi:hypothetical protein
MARKSYVQIDGYLYEKGTEPHRGERVQGPTVIGDRPDFRSPIDGSIVSGRAGLRDHCARYDVVPTQELKGLPHGHPQTPVDRNAVRQDLIKTMYQKGYLK